MSPLSLIEKESKMAVRDETLREKIFKLREEHRNYGVPRISIAIRKNKKVISRVVKKYGLQINRRAIKPFKKEDYGADPAKIPNLFMLRL